MFLTEGYRSPFENRICAECDVFLPVVLLKTTKNLCGSSHRNSSLGNILPNYIFCHTHPKLIQKIVDATCLGQLDRFDNT